MWPISRRLIETILVTILPESTRHECRPGRISLRGGLRAGEILDVRTPGTPSRFGPLAGRRHDPHRLSQEGQAVTTRILSGLRARAIVLGGSSSDLLNRSSNSLLIPMPLRSGDGRASSESQGGPGLASEMRGIAVRPMRRSTEMTIATVTGPESLGRTRPRIFGPGIPRRGSRRRGRTTDSASRRRIETSRWSRIFDGLSSGRQATNRLQLRRASEKWPRRAWAMARKAQSCGYPESPRSVIPSLMRSTASPRWPSR